MTKLSVLLRYTQVALSVGATVVFCAGWPACPSRTNSDGTTTAEVRVNIPRQINAAAALSGAARDARRRVNPGIIDDFTIDYVDMARHHDFDGIVARPRQSQRVLNFFQNSAQRGLLIVGPRNSGKTALIQDAARMVAEANLNYEIRSLDLPMVMEVEGQQETAVNRINNLMTAIGAHNAVPGNPEIILYVPQLDELTVSGTESDQLRTAVKNALVAAVRHNRIRLIADTIPELVTVVQRDRALAEILNVFDMPPMSEHDMRSMLMRYSMEVDSVTGGHTSITSEAIAEALRISRTSGSSEADAAAFSKAYSVLQEANTIAGNATTIDPLEIQEARSELSTLQTQLAFIAREIEQRTANPTRLRQQAEKLARKAELETLIRDMTALLTAYRSGELHANQSRISANVDAAQTESVRNDNSALLAVVNQRIEAAERLLHVRRNPTTERYEVTPSTVRYVITRRTEASRVADSSRAMTAAEREEAMNLIAETDLERLLALEGRMKEDVKGQDAAVEHLARVLRRKRSGIGLQKKPGIALFAGPTGAGKTETVMSAVKHLYPGLTGRDLPFIRFDMSEFQQGHTVARMIGAPPGYVGYGGRGELIEFLIRHPNGTILFDEYEKAHSDIHTFLMTLKDEGRVSSAAGGGPVNGSGATLIMTTNLGAAHFSRAAALLDQGDEAGAQAATAAGFAEIAGSMRPEVWNRIGVANTIIFNPLALKVLKAIAKGKIDKLAKQVALDGITLDIPDRAIEAIATAGYEPAYGARPMERLIQTALENHLGDLKLALKAVEETTGNNALQGTKITVEANAEGNLVMSIDLGCEAMLKGTRFTIPKTIDINIGSPLRRIPVPAPAPAPAAEGASAPAPAQCATGGCATTPNGANEPYVPQTQTGHNEPPREP